MQSNPVRVRSFILTLVLGPLLTTLLACGGGGDTGSPTGGGASSGTGASGGTGAGAGGGATPGCPGPSATCDDVLSGFAACGGDVKGTWTVKTYCGKPKTSGLDPNCPAATLVATVTGGTGEITIDETTFTRGTSNASAYLAMDTPLSCIAPGTCAQIEEIYKSNFDAVCCKDKGDQCHCDALTIGDAPEFTASYTASGSTITIDGVDSEYCVKAGVLSIRSLIGTPDETVQVFEAK